MSELLKSITTKVVGVSFQNDDGTNRQEILSELSPGEAMFLNYFEYENEPAYSVTDSLGNCIGNLSKSLANDLYQKYKDCYFVAQISDITGGYGNKGHYGCILDIDIYDTAPGHDKDIQNLNAYDIVADSANEIDTSIFNTHKKQSRVYSLFYIICGILLILVGIPLLLVTPIYGCLSIVGGILGIVIGRKLRKK